MRKFLMDPMTWAMATMLIMVAIGICAVNIPIYRECRAAGFSAYYCFMQGR
jgi:hypothetical protein